MGFRIVLHLLFFTGSAQVHGRTDVPHGSSSPAKKQGPQGGMERLGSWDCIPARQCSSGRREDCQSEPKHKAFPQNIPMKTTTPPI